jgi:glycosyltransferase involved in cell wall biosynthesis
MTPWLSVLIPTYNGSRFVAEALASIERERDRGIECIVVDGGSSDDTAAIVRGFSSRINLVLREEPRSGNWVWSTNLALRLANAPHASLLHQDDLWLPGRASRIRAVLDGAPDAVLVVHATRFIDAGGKRVGALACPWPPWPKTVSRNAALRALLVQNFISAPSTVFEVNLARSLGGMDEALWYTADWDFWLKLVSNGPVAYCAEQLAAFRLHAGAQTMRDSADGADFRRQLDIVVQRYINGIDIAHGRRSVERLAHFSARLNCALASSSHGGKPDWGSLLREWFSLNPVEWWRFIRDSRIAARVVSRLRANVLAT